MPSFLSLLSASAALLSLDAAAEPRASSAVPPLVEQAPATPAVQAGERLLAALNGDPAARAAFARATFSTTALAREPEATRTAALDRLAVEAGGFHMLQWRPQGDRMVEAVAVSRRGNRHAKFVIFTSGKEPGKITDLFVLPARDPARAAADAFPAASVGEGDLVRLVRRRLGALAEEGSFSGSVLIARGDRVLLREARGMADETWQAANKPDTKFNIASIGKMWTAVVVMKLVEMGKVTLDDTVAQWVPEYPHPAAAKTITLRDLLQHRGGIGEWDGRKIPGPLRPSAAAATMTAPPGQSGQSFGYSNAGYVLLGAAAEKATGLSYEQLVDQLIFRPAGMKGSGFWPVTAVVANRARGYLRPQSDPLGFGPKYSNEQFLGHAGDASGGAYSTVDDLFAFHRALASGKLLKRETLSAMVGTSVEFGGAPRPSRYGLGLRLEHCAGVPTLGHGGGGAGSGISSATYATVDGGWTVIVLGNTDPMPEQVAIDICELVHRS